MPVPGTTRPRVVHAHPRTPDARASRAAVGVRRLERERRRSRPRRIRLTLPAVIALASALLVGGQPAALPILPAGALGDGSRMADPRAAFQAAADLDMTAPRSLTAPSTVGRVLAADGSVPELTGYRWPVEHARITQDFGPSDGGLFIVDGREFHDGIDIANFCGAPILAAHDGTVIAAGRHVVALLGWTGNLAAYDAYLTSKGLWGSQARVIVIDDGNGYRSVYLHLHRIDVTVGQAVRAGQQIGTEGSSGHSTGCHLHYSLYSPSDPGRWATNPKDVSRYHVPTGEIARIDPLTVFPALKVGWISWGWGARDGR